jgi:plastocyanin domain-containing protein
MNKAILIVIAGAAVAGLIFFSGRGSGEEVAANNVRIVDGIQIVEITTKGGYRPRVSQAQAGIPTVIRFKTNGTFDCSIALRIPSENVSMYLPQTGNTDIDVGLPSVGSLQGMCSMGMYRFSVEFK